MRPVKATEHVREAVRLRLPPPGRARYDVTLEADTDLIVDCAPGLEVCAGRISATQYRIWTRKRKAAT